MFNIIRGTIGRFLGDDDGKQNGENVLLTKKYHTYIVRMADNLSPYRFYV